MLEQWQCSQHRMRTVRRRIYAAHLTVCRGIIEQLEQVEIDAFPTSSVNRLTVGLPTAALARHSSDTHTHLTTSVSFTIDTPLTMSTTSVTTTNIPKLTHDPSTYAGWRTAIEVALQLADSWNAALGLDAEPNRARWINRAPGATGTVLARNARAGSAMPEVV